MDRSTLERKSVNDLREIAGQLEISRAGRMRKAELIDAIVGEVDGRTEGGGDAGDAGRDRDEVIERRRARSRNRGTEGDGDLEEAADDDASGRGRGRSRNRRRGRDDGGGNGNGGGGGNGSGDEPEEREGVLDLLPEGYGFLRTTGYVAGHRDVYVSQSYVRRFGLRRGDVLGGPIRFNKGNDKFPALARLETCEGEQVSNEHDPVLHDRPDVDDLTAVFPTEQLVLSTPDAPPAVRLLDAVAPIGRGQRVLVEAPPRSGATTLLRQLAEVLPGAAPDAETLVVLIDERPEEVTEFRRATDVEVVASSFDRAPEDHTAVAELAVERARRLVERGRDVVVLLDSLTTIARAYEAASGGRGQATEAAAVQQAKRLFGAGRATEDGGTLTVVALVRTGTGSPTDDALVAALQGTATTRVRLAPVVTREGLFPAVDVPATWTSRAELLVGDDAVEQADALRAGLAGHTTTAARTVLGEALADADDASTFLKKAVAAVA